MQYHQLCWVYAQREARPASEHSGEGKQTHRVIADIEILNVVKCVLVNPTGTALNLSNINTTYTTLPQDNQHKDIGSSYKKHLKQLILGNIPDILTKIKDSVVDTALENTNNDLEHLFQAARMIRQVVAKRQPWIFDGSFEDYQPPDMLRTDIIICETTAPDEL